MPTVWRCSAGRPPAFSASRDSAEASAPGGRGLALLRDPLVDARLEHVERQGAFGEHGIVEAAQIELGAELACRPRAELEKLPLADLVGQRLPRRHDVAVDLDRNLA